MTRRLPKTRAFIFASGLAALFALSSSIPCVAGPQISNKASVNEALLAAAQRNDLAHIKAFLKEGANPNYRDVAGSSYTALMYAAHAGNCPIARLLLDNKADVNLLSEDLPHNQTALMLAAGSGSVAMLKLLLSQGAAVNLRNNDGETALMFVVNSASARILIDHGAYVNAKTEEFADTVLMRAVGGGNTAVVRTLLSHGAYINEKNKQGDTALKTAMAENKFRIVRLLKRAGAVR